MKGAHWKRRRVDIGKRISENVKTAYGSLLLVPEESFSTTVCQENARRSFALEVLEIDQRDHEDGSRKISSYATKLENILLRIAKKGGPGH